MSAVLYDLFPAYVAVAPAGLLEDQGELSSGPNTPGSYQVQIARVIVTDTEVLIARDGTQGPELVFKQKIDPASFVKSAKKAEDSRLTTLDGKMLAFRKDESCGCGSRLRSWNPFKTSGVMSTKVGL